MEKNTNSMGATGYVFVLKNTCFKEPWLQIGHTAGPLDAELQTLSHELPQDFEVVYTAESAEHEYIARRVHEALSEFRIDPDRRFFLVTEQQAVESVREAMVALDASLPPVPDDANSHRQDTAATREMAGVEDAARSSTEPAPPAAESDDPAAASADTDAAGDDEPSDASEAAAETAPSSTVEPDDSTVVSADPDAPGDDGLSHASEAAAATTPSSTVEPDDSAVVSADPDTPGDDGLSHASEAAAETAASSTVEPDDLAVVSVGPDSTDDTGSLEAASLDPYLVTDFGYLYIIKPRKRVQVTARVAFGITSLGPSHVVKACRKLFGLNPRQLQLLYYGWLETSDTAERIIQMELGRFQSRRHENIFKCPLGWVAECAFQIPGLLNEYRFLRIALGRWARYYDRTPFYKSLEKRAKRAELERERQDFDVEKGVIEARLGRRVRPVVLEEYPPGWKPKKVDHGFDLATDETHHGFVLPSL